ncbi:MAG: hypothetical protein ACOYWZ_18590 [Bacillota bacterium]
MKIKVYRNLSKAETFSCKPKDFKENRFIEIESLKVLFGLSHKFSFDSNDRYLYSNVPDIKGNVIIQANVIGSSRKSRMGQEFYNYLTDCSIYLYPIKVHLSSLEKLYCLLFTLGFVNRLISLIMKD